MESLKKRTKKDSDIKAVERLSLRKEEQEKLEAWVQELNLKFEGMIRLTKSDLANFLIWHHPSKLSTEELVLIEGEHFDEIRWLNWAANKIKGAKKQGLKLTLNQLIAEKEAALYSSIKIEKTRGRRHSKRLKEVSNFNVVSSAKTNIEADSTRYDEISNKQNS